MIIPKHWKLDLLEAAIVRAHPGNQQGPVECPVAACVSALDMDPSVATDDQIRYVAHLVGILPHNSNGQKALTAKLWCMTRFRHGLV